MIINLMQIVAPETVGKRHFFLEAIQTDFFLWCIRIAGVLIIIILFAMYRKIKRKDEE